MTLKVIGAGVGRTGTLSLKVALEQLGFGPCYHMFEVAGQPGHCEAWDAAIDGAPVDWDRLFERYGSAVDWPAAAFWRPLSEHYPDARFILTERDLDEWYTSASGTIFRAMNGPLPRDARLVQRGLMARRLLYGIFDDRPDDAEHAKSVVLRLYAEIKATLPAERLLVYRVSEGWLPLCDFLKVPVPTEPFPHTNTTEQFGEWIKLLGH